MAKSQNTLFKTVFVSIDVFQLDREKLLISIHSNTEEMAKYAHKETIETLKLVNHALGDQVSEDKVILSQKITPKSPALVMAELTIPLQLIAGLSKSIAAKAILLDGFAGLVTTPLAEEKLVNDLVTFDMVNANHQATIDTLGQQEQLRR